MEFTLCESKSTTTRRRCVAKGKKKRLRNCINFFRMINTQLSQWKLLLIILKRLKLKERIVKFKLLKEKADKWFWNREIKRSKNTFSG